MWSPYRHRADYDAKVDAGFKDGDLKRGNWLGSLSGLLNALTPYFVHWKFSFVPGDDMEYEPGIDRAVTNLERANVISSERSGGYKGYHALLLDLDIPAYLVPSSTPGHSHLYVDAKIPHDKYMTLLQALADAGVIEKGYAQVSIGRGHSDLRLPWVSKDDQDLSDNSGAETLGRLHREEADALAAANLIDPFPF